MCLCDFRSPICYVQSFSIPLSLLSNAMGLTQFEFLKVKLCPVSHNDLIMDYFSIENLYSVTRLPISYFDSKIDTKKN